MRARKQMVSGTRNARLVAGPKKNEKKKKKTFSGDLALNARELL